MFDSIAENLQSIFRKLRGRGALTEKNIEEGLREIRIALLQADVHFKIVRDFVESVSKKAIGQKVIRGVDPTQQIIKIVHDELVGLMGPPDHKINFSSRQNPTVIMLVGLNGSGKTTTSAKLAKYLIKRYSKKPLLVAADIQRPAAIEQLKQLSKQNNLSVYSLEHESTVKICVSSIGYAKEQNYDTVILDTAGRLHINQELMEEVKEIKSKVNPDNIFLVADAMTGQDAVNSALGFNKALDISGVILTKIDGDARGGAAISIRAVLHKAIKFVGTGEKIDAFEEFHPDRMASRILGMGDIVGLVEKAQQSVNLDEAKRLQEKIARDELTLQDFLEQLQSFKKMGPLGDIMKMIPGVGAKIGDNIDEKDFRRSEAIIQSMTLNERQNPEILNGSRRLRIAKGSGTSVVDVNSLIKQFNEARKLIKSMKKGKGGMWNLFRPSNLNK